MYNMHSCETREINNLLEDKLKVQVRISVWPGHIPDLAKLLFGLDIYMLTERGSGWKL